MSQYIKLITIMFLMHLPYTFSQQWVSAKGPFGGEAINCFYIDSTSYVYAGSTTGGVYKSTNGGINWIRKSNGLGNQNVSCILKYKNFILAGTETGVFRSNDGGENWLVYKYVGYVNTMIKGPDNWLYIGTESGGVYKTNGFTWRPSNIGLSDYGKHVHSLFFKGDLLFLTAMRDVYRSSTGGDVWEKVLVTTDDVFGMDTTQAGVIYCSTYNNLLNSSDNGVTWNFVSYLSGYSKLKFYRDSLIICSAEGNFSGLHLSTDFGVNWSVIGFQDTNIVSFLFTDDTYYVGSKSLGMFVKKDSSGWINLIGTGVQPVETNSIALLSDGKIIAATETWGFSYTTNLGEEWVRSKQSTGRFREVKAAANGFLFAASDYQVWRSTDKGISWEVSLHSNEFVENINIDYLDNIYVGSDSLFISSNYGASWNMLRHLGPGIYFKETIRIDDSVLLSQTLQIVMWTGIWKLWRSNDNGASWSINLNISLKNLITDSRRRHVLFNTYDKIYISSDKGLTWTTTNTAVAYPRSITLNNNDVLFAEGDDLLIYKSSDFGSNWQLITSPLDLYVNKITAYNDTLLLAATNHGVYLAGQDLVTSAENKYMVPKISISQNYPNPFNPVTHINYTVAEYSKITLKIYDILGKEVETLVNNMQRAGIYEITWDASHFPSGVYFYQIRTGSFMDTKKMTLVK